LTINFSTNTWSIGIRIEHTGSLELSLEGLSVSKKTVRPSRSSKTTTYLELIKHILITTGKFQSGRGQLIVRHYWVFKFGQGYNYWEYEFSPHYQNKFLQHKSLTIRQIDKGKKRKLKDEQIVCSRSPRLFPEIRGRFGKLIAEFIETYTINFTVRKSRMQAYINRTTECNYWSNFLVTLSESNVIRLKCSNYYRLLNLRCQYLQLVLKQHIHIHALAQLCIEAQQKALELQVNLNGSQLQSDV